MEKANLFLKMEEAIIEIGKIILLMEKEYLPRGMVANIMEITKIL